MPNPATHLCRNCGPLPLSSFSTYKTYKGRDYRYNFCKICRCRANRQYRIRKGLTNPNGTLWAKWDRQDK